jgi:hypothetical protein
MKHVYQWRALLALFIILLFSACEKKEDIDPRDAFVGIYNATEVARYSNNPANAIVYNYVLTVNKTGVPNELVISGNLANLQAGNGCNDLYFAITDPRTPEKLTLDASRQVVCANNQRIVFAGSGTLQNNNRTLILNTGATFAVGFSNNVNSFITANKR